jgi:UDP-N-acetylglucosamine acyltransferase
MNLLKKAYKLLYRSDLNVTQALERITSELEQTPEITMLVDFIRNSVRGLTK